MVELTQYLTYGLRSAGFEVICTEAWHRSGKDSQKLVEILGIGVR